MIIRFIIQCFFVEEKKIKRIFLREKDNRINLNAQIIEIINRIKKRIIFFFIFIFLILVVSFVYVLCFNYVYHYTQIDWIKSSMFIIIAIDIVIIIIIFFVTSIRLISLCCKSERLFKLSNIINEI